VRESGRRTALGRLARWALGSLLAAACLASLPSTAAAADPCQLDSTEGTAQSYTCTVGPIRADGYTVEQGVALAPHPGLDGHVTRMAVNLVDADGRRVPVRRLMLHHIVFSNLSRRDATCDSFLSWDSRTPIPGVERFYAAGEELNVMGMPPGYGYRHAGRDTWALYYMVMNHRASRDQAFIRYRITIDTDPTLTAVKPHWLDVRNCLQDPVYTVPGRGGAGSRHVERRTFTIPESGRIVAGGGHVHGGGHRLRLTQPDCNNRQVARSLPSYGMPRHAFYQVRPRLHEPGPIDMSGWGTPTGIPVAAGQRLRLHSIYDNSRPHMRVMGIMVIYIAPDPGVKARCGRLPRDVTTRRTDKPHRTKPPVYRVPLTGLDADGRAVTVNAPPGRVKRVRPGATIAVRDRYFEPANVSIPRGARLNWRFEGDEVHNVTLANGPVGMASRNLDQDRTFSRRFRVPGTYRFMCSLHPVGMTERVVVRKRRR
jgi:plastocyanin